MIILKKIYRRIKVIVNLEEEQIKKWRNYIKTKQSSVGENAEADGWDMQWKCLRTDELKELSSETKEGKEEEDGLKIWLGEVKKDLKEVGVKGWKEEAKDLWR